MASQNTQWIYLSKRGEDEYINRMAQGAGVLPTNLDDWDYSQHPEMGIVLRGIMKHKIMKQCWKDSRPFRYMDTGYFGNRASPQNPQGWKIWHRVVENDLQHNRVIPRPADRWERLRIPVKEHQRAGTKILIVAPDEKPCVFYGIELEQWIEQTTATVQEHTDRPVVVRHRAKNIVKNNRTGADSFQSALADTFAVVTFNSAAGVESIMSGIPVFVTGATNAAAPVANTDLTKIADPWFPDPDLVQQWCRHLAYGQFHNRELEDGTAHAILDETQGLL